MKQRYLYWNYKNKNMNKIKDIEDFAKTRYAGAEKISNGS
jgi:hypothetical protein